MAYKYDKIGNACYPHKLNKGKVINTIADISSINGIEVTKVGRRTIETEDMGAVRVERYHLCGLTDSLEIIDQYYDIDTNLIDCSYKPREFIIRELSLAVHGMLT